MSHKVFIVFADPVLFPAAMPYGAMIVNEALHWRGIDSQILFPFMHKNPVACLLSGIERLAPAVIGFSFRNLDTAGFHYRSDGEQHFLGALKGLVSAAKQSTAITVLGGPGFSIAPVKILEATGADIGFVGPSEEEFSLFCHRIINEQKQITAASENLKSAVLPGCVSPQDAPAPQKLHKINSFNLFGLEYARMAGGAIPVRTKTGCTMRCAYCVVPQIEPLYLKNWDDIYPELVLVRQNHLNERVFLADGEFNVPSEERAIDICEKWYNDFSDTIQWRCYLTEKFVNNRLLQAMKKAGCIGVSLSVDSLSDVPRRGLLKEGAGRAAMDAVQRCLDAGIVTGVNLLFGGPKETIGTAQETALRAYEMNQKGALVNVTIGLRYYPRSPLARLAESDEYSRYAKRCRDVDWMGTFCSPMPAASLAEYVLPVLKPSDTIYYTHDLSQQTIDFYKNIAIGTRLLCEKKYKEAETHFKKLQKENPERKEPQLGIYKAELGQLGGEAGDFPPEETFSTK